MSKSSLAEAAGEDAAALLEGSGSDFLASSPILAACDLKMGDGERDKGGRIHEA